MIPIAKPCVGDEEIAAIEKVIYSGQLVQGEPVREFEEKFAKYCGTQHAVATSNGTTALHTALRALEVGPGDEVIVPAFTFVATATAVSMCGAKPVFIDVDSACNINVEQAENAFRESTKAVIGVHLFGQPFDAKPLYDFCVDNEMFLVEDAAQAAGAEYHGKKVGSLADIACFSFHATKNMTTGEGGMITVSDPDHEKRARMLINHGQKEKYVHVTLGYNYRMTNVAAAIGIVQLDKLDDLNKQRIENAQYYDSRFQMRVKRPKTIANIKHVYSQYTIISNKRDEIMRALNKNGIGTSIHYPSPVNEQPIYKGYPYECSTAKALSKNVLSIPVHPSLTSEELRHIANCVLEVA